MSKKMAVVVDISKLNGELSVSDDDSCGNDGGDIELGLSLEKLNLGPRKKLLVLSIGGFLCQRVHRYDRSKFPKSRRHPDGVYGKTLVYKRPYCEEFVKFCLERFEVGIWSSAKEENVGKALDYVMMGLKNKLLFVWDQEQCTDTGFMTIENTEKPLFLKELDKIWDTKLIPGDFCSSNTLLIDNEPCKALLNPPYTGIFPSEYKVDLLPRGDALGPLRNYLEGLVEAKDVPSYVKDHPFGKAAISDVHPDWSFYLKVVRSLGKGTVRTNVAAKK